MSKSQTLRALVNERLAAAAEEIFVLVERTIAEYEEELCRSKEENQRKQELLDQVLSCRVALATEKFQIPPTSPGPELNQEITETPRIKEEPEEQSVKEEEEQPPEPVPESSAVCVKTEESWLHQRQTEHREDISSEPYFYSETEELNERSCDNDGNWGPPFSSSAAQMETEADGDVQVRAKRSRLSPQIKSAPETTFYIGHVSGAERKMFQCHVCHKSFGTKQTLQTHIRIHTGEKPFGCPVCKKMFSRKSTLNLHIRIHTGEKPYGCSFCKKTFSQKCNLKTHMITHHALQSRQSLRLQPQNRFGGTGPIGDA